MVTSTSSQPSPSDATRSALIHNVSLGALIVCPIIMLLPPRKLDAYTLALASGMFIGGNQLSAEYTGVSIVQRFGNRISSMTTHSLPPKALEMQIRLREEKERRVAAKNGTLAKLIVEKEQAGVLKELELKIATDQAGKDTEKGLLEKIWLGGEGEDWKAKRDRREKKALEDGRGYGGLIMDQIWEVWIWGKNKNEEVKGIDEEVVAEGKEKKAEEKK